MTPKIKSKKAEFTDKIDYNCHLYAEIVLGEGQGKNLPRAQKFLGHRISNK